MCLIVYCKEARPKEEHLENGERSNSHGTGIAWKENGYLRYEKGLDIKETKKMAASLPLGFVIHFRIASVGGKEEQLIHPFPVRLDAPLQQRGKSNKLLFHNGHWSEWKTALLNHLSPKIVLPDGIWSDTRAIALLTAIHGKPFLKVIANDNHAGRFVLMTPAKTTLLGDWKEEEGVYYSNYSYNWGSASRTSAISSRWNEATHAWEEMPTGTGARDYYHQQSRPRYLTNGD